MTALVLFPSRIPFVNPDGTLTPEAYRALQTLANQTTSGTGSVSDVFADVMGDMTAGSLNIAVTDVVQQAGSAEALPEVVVMQPTAVDSLPDMVMQISGSSRTAPETVTPSGSPYTYTATRDGYLTVQGGTVSKVEYVRGSAVDTGVIAGLFPILLGDGLTVTYTVAPTMKFIPR